MPAYVYNHEDGHGLGEHHAKEAGRELPAEMRDLDMPAGTPVEHVATDEANGFLIVAWTDLSGTLRHSSVSPEFFAGHFTDGSALSGDGAAGTASTDSKGA